ncbi:MAG: hypothetical protein RL563_333 [Pseudomonadota bacterium]|jgi:anti-anti-sigma regulatory factor
MAEPNEQLDIDGETTFSITAIRIHQTLVVTLPADLGFGGMNASLEKISESLKQKSSKKLILECSGLQFLDITEYNKLKLIADMASFQGIVTYVVGINPGIAAYLALNDVDLSGIVTRQSLEEILDETSG